MLQFLASVYIEDVELPLDVPINDSQNVLELMIISEAALTQCLFEQEHLLPKYFHDYVYYGIFAFLRSVFEYHVSIETVGNDKVEFYTRLVDLTLQILPKTYDDEKALQSLLTCLDSMINVAGIRGSSNPLLLRDLLKEATINLEKLYAKTHSLDHQSSTTIDAIVPIKDSMNEDFQSYFNPLQASMALKHYRNIEFEKLCKCVNTTLKYLLINLLNRLAL